MTQYYRIGLSFPPFALIFPKLNCLVVSDPQTCFPSDSLLCLIRYNYSAFFVWLSNKVGKFVYPLDHVKTCAAPRNVHTFCLFSLVRIIFHIYSVCVLTNLFVSKFHLNISLPYINTDCSMLVCGVLKNTFFVDSNKILSNFWIISCSNYKLFHVYYLVR